MTAIDGDTWKAQSLCSGGCTHWNPDCYYGNNETLCPMCVKIYCKIPKVCALKACLARRYIPIALGQVKGRFTHSMPCPCRAAKGLECVFPIWFTQCGRVWFTLAMPHPFHALTMPFFSRPRHSAAVKRRPVGYLPAFGFFRLPRGVPQRLLSEAYQSSSQQSIPVTVKSGRNTLQKDNLLNCWTSSSDISGYHADFHEGHTAVEAGQWRGMLCVNPP